MRLSAFGGSRCVSTWQRRGGPLMQIRWGVSIGSFFVAGLLAGSSIASVGGRQESTDKQTTPTVDVELVIAVDVSYSMDLDELAIQREGYAQAIVSKEFLQALRGGPN